MTAQKHEVAVQVATATPSLLALFITKVMELPLEKWVALVSLCFLLLQAAFLIWNWRRKIKKAREEDLLRPLPVEADSQ